MANSKRINNESVGDPELDLQGTFPMGPNFYVGRTALADMQSLREAAPKKPKPEELFIAGHFDFVPDSRASINLALSDVHERIQATYKNSNHPMTAVGKFYDRLKGLKARAALENSQLSDALTLKTDQGGGEFSALYLRDKDEAMRTVALHEVRASTLAQGKRMGTSKQVEKSVNDELSFMTTLGDEELKKRWQAAMESSISEYGFWDHMLRDAEHHPLVEYHLASVNARDR